MKKRILFVDDEPNVLAGLQRMLRPLRGEWEVTFAQSGPEALEKLAAAPFDVVVSDMRMPGMDGAALLAEVRQRYPGTVRIVLSGHSDKEMILRSVGPAHQYLAKPCDAETLKDTISRACALRNLLADESLKQVIAQMPSLPSLPAVYAELTRTLNSPDASVQAVGRIIASDVGMTAKILQLVNSAFFGLRRHVSSPAEAAVLLGLETIKALVLSVQVFSEFRAAQLEGFSLEALWKHSLATGAGAKQLAADEKSDGKLVDCALMAGLLHDAGKLVLAAHLGPRYGQTIAAARERGLPLWQAERETLGTTHAEVGAYLLGLWGLPDPIVEAIAFHHEPGRCLAQSFGTLTAIHVADFLDHEMRPEACQTVPSPVDVAYLSRIGAADRLNRWRETFRSAAERRGG